MIEGLLSSIGPDFDENNTKSLELLPKLIERASQLKAVKIPDTRKNLKQPIECAGTDYVDNFLLELSRRDWPRILVVPLITTIRDLHLTENQLLGFVRKIAREARQLELQALPPFAYQVAPYLIPYLKCILLISLPTVSRYCYFQVKGIVCDS